MRVSNQTSSLALGSDGQSSSLRWLWWVGAGVLGAAALGYAAYRWRVCVGERTPSGIYWAQTQTTHPKALTAEKLAAMKMGDKVKVALEKRDRTNNHERVRGVDLLVVSGKLGGTEDEPHIHVVRCPGVDVSTLGPLIQLDGTLKRGYAQFAGSLFPADFDEEYIDEEFVYA